MPHPATLASPPTGPAPDRWIVDRDAVVLVTGAAGFLGHRVVAHLLQLGFRRIRCLVRPSGSVARLQSLADAAGSGATLEIIRGNLLSREDCAAMTRGAAVIYHLAAGTGSKSFADAYLNSVVTTRNLVEGALDGKSLRRFVNISSFAVYSNRGNPHGRLLDEDAPIEPDPATRAEAYCYAKVRQDELVLEYGRTRGLPCVLIRPGVVFGPGKHAITGRIGTDSFGIFLHLGGSNPIPFTYVENCAEAVVLAGLVPGVEREAFNVVDDDLPTSREFLRLYQREVRPLRSVYVPHALSYLLCWLWERYCAWSQDQLPPIFTRREWDASWKFTRYSNARLKDRLGWRPRVPMREALQRYFDDCRLPRKAA